MKKDIQALRKKIWNVLSILASFIMAFMFSFLATVIFVFVTFEMFQVAKLDHEGLLPRIREFHVINQGGFGLVMLYGLPMALVSFFVIIYIPMRWASK